MKILLAGGAGYIGSLLAPQLKEEGYEVDVIDLLWFGNFLPKDIPVTKRDIYSLQVEDLKGYDQIVFLGGLSNDPMAEYCPAKNFVYNSAMPAYLAYQARLAGVRRLVYASSCSVYGYTVNQLYDEDSPVSSTAPYGISKLQGERGVIQAVTDKFSVICLRKGTVCGWSPRMRFDLIVNTMYKSAMQTGVITVNNPSIWRPLLDIRDAVSAYKRAIQADYSISGVFNAASENTTVGQVADMVRDEMSLLTGKKIRINIHHKEDYRNYKVTSERAKTILGFQPRYTMLDTVRNVHEHRDRYGDFDNPIYSNIRTFHQLEEKNELLLPRNGQKGEKEKVRV
jgi:nucleoside-diphosphate-sugar epimerase